jgi:DNA repair exonuclease SbcCD ATPase subunit
MAAWSRDYLPPGPVLPPAMSRLPIGPRLLDNVPDDSAALIARQREKLESLRSEKERLRLELEEQRELAEKQRLLQELEETKRRNAELKALEESKRKQQQSSIQASKVEQDAEAVLLTADAAKSELQQFLPSQSPAEKQILQAVIDRLDNLCGRLKSQKGIHSLGLIPAAELEKSTAQLKQLVTQVGTLLAASKVRNKGNAENIVPHKSAKYRFLSSSFQLTMFMYLGFYRNLKVK